MRRSCLTGLGLAIGLACGPALRAGQVAPNAPAASPAGAVTVLGVTGNERVLTGPEFGSLPQVQLKVAVEPGHGSSQRIYEGPLLWTVLERSGAVDPGKVRDHVREVVLATGRDGYTVALALSEISPEFEGKQVIVATRVDGQPLESGQPRLVVPGEKRAGRSARDLVRLQVLIPR